MKNRVAHMLVAVYLVLLKNNDQVLMLLRQNTGYMDGKYGLIAGHVEKGERVTTSLCREAYEEAGIKIDPEQLKFIHAQQRVSEDNRVYIDFFFKADVWENTIENHEPNKCLELRWFSLNDLPPNTVPYIREVLQNHISHSGTFSGYGW